MDACAACGARLAPDLVWCPQCLAPTGRPAAAAGVTGVVPTGDSPLWVRTQMRDRGPATPATYSRFRAGPTSFGALGRAMMSLGVLVGAVVGYPMTRGLILASIGFDVPGKPFMIGYTVAAVIVSIYLLARIWRRARIA